MTAPAFNWLKMELPNRPYYLTDTDYCVRAREYVSHAGKGGGDTNNIVKNFKKDPSRRANQKEWYWKGRAISQFAQELAVVLGGVSCIVASIPTSRIPSDPQYDSRFDDMFVELSRRCPALRIERPIQFSQSHLSQHQRGDERLKPHEVYALLQWNGFSSQPNADVILVDDIITTGSHFKACQRLIQERHPGTNVYGAFWAQTTWQPVVATVV